jgi:hypothetical protein
MTAKLVDFYAFGITMLKAGMSGFVETYPSQDDRFVFYWTDSVTGKGTKFYVESETERDAILQHYFEASIGPIEDVGYNSKPTKWTEVISRKQT